MGNEIQETARRLREASETILVTTETLKATADQLRQELAQLEQRIFSVETDGVRVAEELVTEKQNVQSQQQIQDGRLDTLET